MISYTMVGTRDLGEATRFYDPLFAEMGLETCWQSDTHRCWGIVDDDRVPRFIVGYPFDERPASSGNGVMTAFRVPSAAKVARLHAIALAHGGTCEGAPGPRPQYGDGFHAAYVRDPDGNKIAFVHF